MRDFLRGLFRREPVRPLGIEDAPLEDLVKFKLVDMQLAGMTEAEINVRIRNALHAAATSMRRLEATISLLAVADPDDVEAHAERGLKDSRRAQDEMLRHLTI